MARLSYKIKDFDLHVRRSRTGLGLFTESEIPKGSCIIEYKGVPLTEKQEEESNSRYLFEINSRKTIDGAPRWNTARYINHSCRPNCEPNIYKGRIYIHARRKIKPGEELNYDYGINYFKQIFKGNCLCEKCKPSKPVKKAKADSARAAAARTRSKKVSAPKAKKKRA
ncbi:SET domain-containing protein [Terricaulis sp.]|uniref:SET domain-containing protein n=1 Tax=Terricaulis sp. TaxID=2768686 RepID=UPI0037852DB5